ncbi:hypothetical protein ABW20_dc0102584 [Dactylellina cionopaga]|nr:hypothetical protein ABW20_dc0102584 [Dactylellina cionopaga]
MADTDPAADEYDELFDYDIDEIETTYNTNANAKETQSNPSQTTTANPAKSSKTKAKDDDDLGLDGEIKIRKRKAPAKLTEEMLLGPDGIPYLQEHAAKKLKFKGKGHEISDLGRLLKFYQIWADNLFPKAQFKDVIEIIEKLGASRGMHRKREEWIQAFKMKQTEEDDRLVKKARDLLAIDSIKPEYDASGRLVVKVGEPLTKLISAEPEPESSSVPHPGLSKLDHGDSLFFHDDDDDDMDDMDAILREVENSRSVRPLAQEEVGGDEIDELDAIMQEMEGNTSSNRTGPSTSQAKQSTTFDHDEDEFEEAMAAMRDAER